MANIITFYSYKGGVGRSMALANMACLIAQSGRRVLMIDWDLEAPGLHKYFYPYLANDHHNKLGLIDFYIRASNELDSIPYGAENESSINTFLSNLPDYTQDIVLSNTMRLSFIQAGSLSASYAKNVDEFDWERFFKKIPSFFSYFADYISSQYDYVLIDSRTGYTDMGGICTVLLPTKLVLVFSPNQQNLDSVFEVGKKAMEYRRRWGSNSLSIYPLPSRIEMQEQQLRIEWEAIYKRKFEDFYSELYQLNNLSLDDYFSNIKIPHFSFYSYGEKIAVIEESPQAADTLANAYYRFYLRLTEQTSIWELKIIPFYLSYIASGENNNSEVSNRFIGELNMLVNAGLILPPTNPIVSPFCEAWNDNHVREIHYLLQNPQPYHLLVYILSTELLQTEWYRQISPQNCLVVLLPQTPNFNQLKSEIRKLRERNIAVITTFEPDSDASWVDLVRKLKDHLMLVTYQRR